MTPVSVKQPILSRTLSRVSLMKHCSRCPADYKIDKITPRFVKAPAQ